MSTVQLLIVCVFGLMAVVAVVAGAVVVAERAAPEAAPQGVGRAITLHTHKPDDQTIHGVVVAEFTDRYVLEAARYVTAAGDNPIPGTVSVPKASVSWIQQHDAAPLAAVAS